MGESPWNPPLSMELIPWDENKNSFTAKQVNALLDNEALPIGKELTVNCLDNKYSSPEYIAQTHDQEHLVNIIRLPSNRTVWKKLNRKEQLERRASNPDSRGADVIYGQSYSLKKAATWDLRSDQQDCFGIKLSNGKCCEVEVDMWEDMMLRSKRGHSMKDKPFSLVRIRLVDAQSQQPLFQKDMWLGVWGKRRNELTGEEIYWAFRNRYDIEHFLRFGKQRLLLDKFQTPDQEHLQNWLEVVNLAYWLLWSAKEEAVQEQRHKWRQYDKSLAKRRENDLWPSPSQVQQQLEGIILSFEQAPFLPNPRKKGKGRKAGTTLPKRQRFPVQKRKKKT